MENIVKAREYFEEYLMENNVNVNSDTFDKLLDIIYNETMEYFGNYEEFYNFYTVNLQLVTVNFICSNGYKSIIGN